MEYRKLIKMREERLLAQIEHAKNSVVKQPESDTIDIGHNKYSVIIELLRLAYNGKHDMLSSTRSEDQPGDRMWFLKLAEAMIMDDMGYRPLSPEQGSSRVVIMNNPEGGE